MKLTQGVPRRKFRLASKNPLKESRPLISYLFIPSARIMGLNFKLEPTEKSRFRKILSLARYWLLDGVRVSAFSIFEPGLCSGRSADWVVSLSRVWLIIRFLKSPMFSKRLNKTRRSHSILHACRVLKASCGYLWKNSARPALFEGSQTIPLRYLAPEMDLIKFEVSLAILCLNTGNLVLLRQRSEKFSLLCLRRTKFAF